MTEPQEMEVVPEAEWYLSLLRRAWFSLDALKAAHPENWRDDYEQVMKDLIKADYWICTSMQEAQNG